MRQIALMMSGSFFFTTAFMAYHLFQTVNRLIEKTSVDAALKNNFVAPIAAVSAAMLVASFIVPKFFVQKERSAQDLLRGPDPEWEKGRSGKRFTAFIVSLALCESAAIFGFMIGLTVNSFEIACPFFVVAAVVMAIHLAKIQDI